MNHFLTITSTMAVAFMLTTTASAEVSMRGYQEVGYSASDASVSASYAMNAGYAMSGYSGDNLGMPDGEVDMSITDELKNGARPDDQLTIKTSDNESTNIIGAYSWDVGAATVTLAFDRLEDASEDQSLEIGLSADGIIGGVAFSTVYINQDDGNNDTSMSAGAVTGLSVMGVDDLSVAASFMDINEESTGNEQNHVGFNAKLY